MTLDAFCGPKFEHLGVFFLEADLVEKHPKQIWVSEHPDSRPNWDK